MPKRIVLCIDGTYNQFGKRETNVLRIYRAAVNGSSQLCYYQPGVGTLQPPQVLGRLRTYSLQVADAATAWMLERHVSSAYRFLMAHYEPDDELFLFGFSRGAYSVRVLAGMLHTIGLLRCGHEEMVPFAWKQYGLSWQSEERAASFRSAFGRPVAVHFVGVWDTVSSVGTPWSTRPLPFTARNRSVRCLRHAVALEERRVMFAKNLWSAAPEPGQDVRQVWFAGTHSDVGGGAGGDLDPPDELSIIPLWWMIDQARAKGLVLDDTRLLQLTGVASLPEATATYAACPSHESLSLGWLPLEYIPVPRWMQKPDGDWRQAWQVHRKRSRSIPEGTLAHVSVEQRIQGGIAMRGRPDVKRFSYVER